jgi:hypothetical protein
MRKIYLSVPAIALVLIFGACKKSNTTTADAKTVENLSGTYTISAIKVSTGGVDFDEFASLKDCEKDNTITLHTDLTLDYTDAGTQCAPPESSTGTWRLSSNSDSLYISGVSTFPDGVGALIQTWNGTSLVLNTTNTISGHIASTTITLNK